MPLHFHPDTGKTSWNLDFVLAVEKKGQGKVEARVGRRKKDKNSERASEDFSEDK